MASSRALAWVSVALGLPACSAPPAAVEVGIGECFQPATREPLPEALVEFLPTIGRPRFLENADQLLADGTVSLASRPPFELPETPTWLEDPYGDPSWVYEYQSLFFVLELLLAYQETGASRYLDAVELYVRRWSDAHLRPGFGGHWGDHVMANRTRVLLLAWERLRARSESAEIVGEVCRALELHAIHLTSADEYTDHHNHGHFQDEALLALAYAFSGHPDQAEWMDLARQRLAKQITDSVTAEGVHKEHTPSYHAGMQFRYTTLADLLDALELELPIDLDGVITAMFEYMTYGTLPNGDAPLVGDSSRWFGSTNTPRVTPEALYSFSQGRSGSPPAEVDRVFFDSGYAFFRDAWHPAETFADTIYVGFFAGVFSRVHKHSDDMSVFVYGYGHEWLTDIGFWSYDVKDPYTHLSRASAGHNVVTIDGRDYFDQYPAQRGDPAPKLLTDFDLSPEVSTVTGEHQFHPGVLYRRQLTYERPARVRVVDTLTATDGDEHRYFLSWHLAPDKQVTETGPRQYLVRTQDPDGPSMTLGITGNVPPDCEIIHGADDPYQGWYFPRFLQYEPAPVIVCRIRGTRDAAFETQAELFGPGQ
jgi:hypothetical protein